MKIIKNYIYNTLYQVMILIIPLITMPYLTRIFSPAQLGLNSYTLSIVNYFMLFGMLGIQLYGSRQIAYVRDDKIKLTQTFWSIYTIQLIVSTISLFLYYIFILFFIKYNLNIYVVQGLNIITVIIDISWFFTGIEDFKKVVIRNSFAKIIGLLSIFIFVKNSDDLYIYILLTALINIFSMAIMWGFIKKYIGKFSINKFIVRDTLKPLLKLFLPQIATQVYLLLSRTMIGILSTDNQVAFYDYSQKMVRMVLALITSVGVVLLPRISNVIGNGKKDKVPNMIKKTFEFVSYFAIPMSLGLMSIANKFISWFLGKEYYYVGYLTSISSLIIIAVSWANIIGIQYLVSTKQENKYTFSVIVSAIINILMNLLLINSYGAFGAVISLIVAEYIGIFIQMYLVKGELPIVGMIKSTLKYFIASSIMALIVLSIGLIIENAFLANIIQVIIGICTYLLLMYIFKDSIQTEIIFRIKNLICNKKSKHIKKKYKH
ncbi:oligosaccharide flippase family protein [Clostridium perfringens]|uniref:oligosaccharide flippase family protein n=1 Tax=Clostridium perfringens TaxID=1502 RepID=UPI002853186E|nr:oligosaccharide flippase family protein [Clostridium perfringens]EJT6340964.1 oligosaccharide flippase family protein [Clostridium perfringens]CAJ1609382.1 lipid II flippase MurJ [Clostridium perfringens]